MQYMKKLLAAVLVLTLSFSCVALATLQDDLNRNQQEQNETRRRLQEIEGKKDELEEQIDKTEGQIDATNDRISEIQAEIDLLDAEIAQLEVELQAAILEMERQDKALKARMRVMYENGEDDYLEIILTSGSFEEAVKRVGIVKEIMDYDKKVMEDRKMAVDRVELKKIEIEGKRQAQAELRAELDAQKGQLTAQKAEQEKQVGELTDEQKKMQSHLDQLSADSERIRQQIQGASSSSANVKYTGGAFMWPLNGYYVLSSYFGNRKNPTGSGMNNHTGIDIPAPKGVNVLAAKDGVVFLSGWNGGYGNCVIINHGTENGKSVMTLYAHNSALVVKAGQTVKQGDVIAKVGSTGNSNGNHSHFEVRIDGTPVNPLNYF